MRHAHSLLLLVLAGCYSEGIQSETLRGTLVVPREAATRTINVLNPDGSSSSETMTDVGFLGPVYIGLYAAVLENIETYPHPERGPAFSGVSAGKGDTYPYGGTTIGDIRYACYEALQCKLTSGRFETFDDIVAFYDMVGFPITDAIGNEVVSGEQMRETCFELFEVQSDAEMRLTWIDKDADGEPDPDFVENADGDFEASFEMLQQEFYPGMAVWAYLDNPFATNFELNTCNKGNGYNEFTYNRRFQAGLQQADTLNAPHKYITEEDWVTSMDGMYIWDDPEASASLRVDFSVKDGVVGGAE